MSTTDLESDTANELYLAVAAMRASTGRMRAMAERMYAEEEPQPANQPEPPRQSDYSREFGREFGRDPFAEPPQSASEPNQAIGYHPYLGQVDAAVQHLQRARLPDLNTLAEMMMKMKGAQAAYELNMQMLDATHDVMARTVDLLRR
jgi:hypothetical protein